MTTCNVVIGMAKWFGFHYNQEVCFSSAVNDKKGPSAVGVREEIYLYCKSGKHRKASVKHFSKERRGPVRRARP